MAVNESLIASSRMITQFGDSMAINFLIGIALIIIGVFIGRVIVFFLSKLATKIELNKKIRESFIRLFLVIIQWSIYIIFIDFALKQFNVPLLTNMITRVIIVIPAITSALILIAVGAVIAFYLREIIEDSEIMGWKVISMYFFYFVLYIFGVYSLKIALVSMDNLFVNIIVVVLTAVVASTIAYISVKKELQHK